MHWDPHIKLDYIKLVIRTKVLEIRARNKVSESQLQALRRELEEFNNLTQIEGTQLTRFNDLRLDIHKEEEKQAEKLRIMAGVKWREEGERSTKYFLNAIKIREAGATVDYLQTEIGKIDNYADIVSYARGFYEQLYSHKETVTEDSFFQACPKLSVEAHEDLSKELTIADLEKALKTCKDSTPGLDGIPYSYYKLFAKELLPLILDAWAYTRVVNKLPNSQLTSCISLIPKSGKDKYNIKNWRPISLSSCDLKIITKALSHKVSKYLQEIIFESQMGYVPGRNINFNNRLIRAAITYCKSNKVNYTLTSLDAQKAYDSVSHSYIKTVLKAYNFPDSFINIVDVLHSNLKAVVQVNGHLSTTFDICRGVKQGDALSCALFVISIDPLIRNIELNERIPSLSLTQGCNVKTFAYADDIAVITLNDNVASAELFKEYNKLTNNSGLTLNADKTDIINLSNIGKMNSEMQYNNESLKIEHKESVTVCGNYISLDEDRCYEKNILEKITKLEHQLNRWRGRNLTLNGKMIIIKTFAISQLIFSSQFQNLRTKEMRKVEHLCYSFAWNGKDHGRRSIVKAERHHGGINGIDVDSFFKSIAIRQFFKSYSDNRLNVINNSSTIIEDIKTTARTTIRKILLKQLVTTNLDYQSEVEWLIKTPVLYFAKPYSKSHSLMESLSLDNIGSINLDDYPRAIANKIRRCLPVEILLVIDRGEHTINQPSGVSVTYENKWYDISKINSRNLNFILKMLYNKIEVYNPSNRYSIDVDNNHTNIQNTWHNLWCIKNPTLRAIRLKILYKDVWSNER